MIVFLIAFLQMGWISSQMFHIAHQNYLAALFCSVGISCCWLFNVNAAIKGDWIDKTCYVSGAASGTLLSMYINAKLYGV